MKFKKIYIEITNSCNFGCSYCFKTTRPAKFMSVDDFRTVITKIRPFTNYVYLHVLGEPLLHPKFGEILNVAAQAGMFVNITTNGSLISKKKDILLHQPVRQLNISLHDAEENIQPNKQEAFILEMLDFSLSAAKNTYINLRLWNEGSATSKNFNELCLHKICEHFQIQPEKLLLNGKDTGVKLADHIFFQPAPRFEWPDGENTLQTDNKTCYALRDHIAILAEGTIIPCCLDADAGINLGNIFTDNLQEVMLSERVLRMKNGFTQGKITEKLCESCGFIIN